MIHKDISFDRQGRVVLTTYIHEHYPGESLFHGKDWQPRTRPAVLILPGGGYTFLSARESEPVVFPFLNAGFNAFVLRYSVGKHSAGLAPLDDVSRGLWEIRRNAANWHINPDQIAVGGFSAGGNLATLLGTQWNTPGLAARLNIPEEGNKPNAIFPCYPLTGKNLVLVKEDTLKLGAIVEDDPPELDTYKYVGPHTPPVFIWHTYEDDLLSPQNALLFAQACVRERVPVELHLFQYGLHGLSLNNDLTDYGSSHPINVSAWVPLCIEWMKSLFKF